MVNFTNFKLFTCVLCTILTFAFTPKTSETKSQYWGFYGHKRINRMAVFTLPPTIFGFYKDHIEYLTENATNPDSRRYVTEGEAQRHFIDLDHFYLPGEDFRKAIPRKWEDAVQKFSEDTLQAYGIVPWHINTMKMRLQKAFEAKDVDRILFYSTEIGHYIGDAHVPLHTSENYNGQLTNQKGIHGLWESRLVEINAENYDYFVGKAKYIDRPLDFAWETVFSSHEALDSVLRIERELTNEFPADRKYSFEQRGTVTNRVYSMEFSQAYHQRLNGMVERRMRRAIVSIGSMWYTAWVDAGQPNLEELRGRPVSPSLLEEIQELEHQHRTGMAKGRICD